LHGHECHKSGAFDYDAVYVIEVFCMSRQCPRCGAFDDESPFVGSLCRECHVELNMPTLPRKITIYTCRDCGTEKFKGWLDQDIPAEIAYSLKSKIFGIPKIRVLDDCIEVAYKGIPEPSRSRSCAKNQCATRARAGIPAITRG